MVYKNVSVGDQGWIDFALEGTRSNRSAIGAEVELYWGGMKQIQQIEGGNGFAAQNQRRVHFGLGSVAAVDSAVIRWPSGVIQAVPSPGTRSLHRIKEPA